MAALVSKVDIEHRHHPTEIWQNQNLFFVEINENSRQQLPILNIAKSTNALYHSWIALSTISAKK